MSSAWTNSFGVLSFLTSTSPQKDAIFDFDLYRESQALPRQEYATMDAAVKPFKFFPPWICCLVLIAQAAVGGVRHTARLRAWRELRDKLQTIRSKSRATIAPKTIVFETPLACRAPFSIQSAMSRYSAACGAIIRRTRELPMIVALFLAFQEDRNLVKIKCARARNKGRRRTNRTWARTWTIWNTGLR